MSQVYNVMIQGPGPWGFRLAGGKDFGVPLQISRVTPGSKASLNGIKANDTLLAISGYDVSDMTHMEAQNLIKGVVGNLSLKLETSNQATIWSPEISQQADTGYSVSLKANKQQFQHAGSSHNVKPRLFPGAGGGAAQPQSGPSMVHKQFNSPVGIYSAQNVADSYRGQTEGVSAGNRYDDDQQAPPTWQKPSAYGSGSSQGPKSTSFKLLQQHVGEDERDYGGGYGGQPAPVSAPAPAPVSAPVNRPGGTRSVRPPVAKPTTGGSKPADALPVCYKCNQNIMGPFVKVRGKPMHDVCFTCESCAISLRNKGFFVISEKLYCEACKDRIQQRQPGQLNGSSAKSAPKSPSKSKAGPPKVANDNDEHAYQNGTSNAPSYATPSIQTYPPPPEPANYGTSQADSDFSSDFPDPPPFITEHAPIASSHRNGRGDATDSGYSDHQREDTPPLAPASSGSTLKTVLASTPEPWNPNESYTSPVIRSVRAPSGKSSARSPSPADSNSVPEDGVKVMFVPKNHLGKPPSQVAGRTTTTTKTFTTSYQSPQNTAEDDMAAPPPPPPPQIGGGHNWRANNPSAARPSPTPAAYRGGPPPAPKGQPPRSVFPQPPPSMLQQRASAPPTAPKAPVAPPPAQRMVQPVAPPAPRGPPAPPPQAPPPQAQRGPPGPPVPPPQQRKPQAPPSALASPPPWDGRPTPVAAGMTRTPYCETCNEIVKGPFVTAFGKNWHPEHFSCGGCNENLQGKGVIESEGKILCETCYTENYAPKCARCNGSITGECVKAMGQTYHPSCFTCVVCNQPITGDGFHMQDGMTYCKRDFQNKFRGVNCSSCNFPIEAGEAWLEALDKSYHAECFTCTQCNQPLEGQRFYQKAGRPYCQAHGS